MTYEEYINQHPEQFTDGIDKWLFTEFGIIGGCCSAEKSHEYSVARMVAEKLTDAFIEKAEDFISRKICDYIVHYNYGPNNDMETMYVDSRFFEDFKNYMKEE